MINHKYDASLHREDLGIFLSMMKTWMKRLHNSGTKKQSHKSPNSEVQQQDYPQWHFLFSQCKELIKPMHVCLNPKSMLFTLIIEPLFSVSDLNRVKATWLEKQKKKAKSKRWVSKIIPIFSIPPRETVNTLYSSRQTTPIVFNLPSQGFLLQNPIFQYFKTQPKWTLDLSSFLHLHSHRS